MRPENLVNRKFVHHYPQFGNGNSIVDDFPDWQEAPEKIYQTSKGIRWDQSVFFWWFCYFLENEEYTALCYAKREKSFRQRDYRFELVKIYDDWGDIRRYKNDFRKWFYDIGGLLFCEPFYSSEITEIKLERDIDSTPIKLQISIPVLLPLKSIRRQFEKMLKDRREEVAYEKGDSISRAKYPVHIKNPKVKSLERDLIAWEMRREGATANTIHEALFDELSEEKIIKLLDKQGQSPTEEAIKSMRADRYDRNVRRAVKKTDAAIKNTALGKFPCFDVE